MREVELLIPARDLDAGMAAVDHGADAVYIGGPGFGARGAAGNPVGDIARLADYAHPFGVKVYAAVNTLIYEDELHGAEKLARELVSAGVDALIIQDTALLMMGIEGVAFHASTQMCNTTAEHVRFLGRSGFSRVVLERGLSLEKVREITAACGVETECFVHGAICVGHSGRCYLSRSMGPRSGNRGVCAQPCRMKYDLEDGDGKTIVQGKHLLSVRDLDLSDHLERLIDAGVTSLKVEGRLKDTAYVKNITAWYREKLDGLIARRGDLKRSSDGRSTYGFTPDPARSFSRGTTAWTAFGAPAGSSSFDTPKALGQPVGPVEKAGDGYFVLSGPVELSPGDGICFFSDGNLRGTNINRVEGRKVYPNRMDGLVRGTELFRNHDHRFTAALGGAASRRAVPVMIRYTIDSDRLAAEARDERGSAASAEIECGWGPAGDTERMRGVIEKQLSRSGGTVFDVTSVAGETSAERVTFIPVSALNALRRELLDRLKDRRLAYFDKKKKEKLAGLTRDDRFPYPVKRLGGEGNVTNSLARAFWTGRGVETIDTAFDLRERLDGERVMTTPLCLRRELGRCLKDHPADKGKELYLRSGDFRYRLGFDCKRCLMSLLKCTPDK